MLTGDLIYHIDLYIGSYFPTESDYYPSAYAHHLSSPASECGFDCI